MQLQVPVSVGEVLDKITILQIKLAHISDANKRVNIQNELDALLPLVAGDGFATEEMQGLMAELKLVNEALWDIEDDIREKEAAKSFDAEFIKLARAVYVTNDKRAEIKKQINLATGSALVEEKSYESY
jgi:prophage tail gpP-like protein